MKEVWRRDDEQNVDLYTRLIAEHRTGFRGADWGGEQSQSTRFAVLAEVGCLNGRRILDVGCGTGGFLAWLRREGLSVDYTGIDLTPAAVAEARQRFPDARFHVGSALDAAPPEAPFDFVFASGIFCHRKAEPFAYLLRAAARMYELCTEGIAFNSLSTWASNPEPDEFVVDPLAVLASCRRITPRLCLRHDYLPHDFTVYLFKGEWPR